MIKRASRTHRAPFLLHFCTFAFFWPSASPPATYDDMPAACRATIYHNLAAANIPIRICTNRRERSNCNHTLAQRKRDMDRVQRSFPFWIEEFPYRVEIGWKWSTSCFTKNYALETEFFWFYARTNFAVDWMCISFTCLRCFQWWRLPSADGVGGASKQIRQKLFHLE